MHNLIEAAIEAAVHFEAPVPAAEVAVADSRVGIGALVAMAPELRPVNRTMLARAVEHHKPQTLARRPRFTARLQHMSQRILSDRLKTYR